MLPLQPFGDDITDLPLDKFCHAIETQIAAVFNDTFPTNTGHMSVWPSRKLRIDKAVNFDDNKTFSRKSIILTIFFLMLHSPYFPVFFL